MPNPALLSIKNVGGVDLVLLLGAMNARIEYLYDREHVIGHSFFMDLTADSTLSDVARIFKNNVLPLLEEYFFEDWGKISTILGNSGIYELQPSAILGVAQQGKAYRRRLDRLQVAATYHGIYKDVKLHLATAAEQDDD